MNRRIAFAFVFAFLLGLAIWFTNRDAPSPGIEAVPPAAAAAVLSGDSHLAGHGTATMSARDDLQRVARLTEAFLVQHRHIDSRHYATNAQLADLLRSEEFVFPENAIFGKNGQLQDRWGNPYILHPRSQGVLEFRSAGPDGEAYSSDDLVFDPTGRYTEPQ